MQTQKLENYINEEIKEYKHRLDDEKDYQRTIPYETDVYMDYLTARIQEIHELKNEVETIKNIYSDLQADHDELKEQNQLLKDENQLLKESLKEELDKQNQPDQNDWMYR